MMSRSGYGSSPQYHLVYHEFTIVFANGSSRLFKPGIGQVGALRPFPSFPPCKLRGRCFPFEFRGEAHSLPGGISDGFVIADMTDGRLHSKGPQAGERIIMPFAIYKVPVQRGLDLVVL